MPFLSLVNRYLNSPYEIEYKQETGSTNDDLMSAADSHTEFFVIAADAQTCGRGRKTRQFYSPCGSGIYFSILLKPSMPPERAVFITTAAAVAVCDAISQCSGKTPAVKWVNDIFLGGKKVCGILTEGRVENGSLKHAVLGIGINLTPPKGGYPQEISGIAGSIFDTLDEDTKAKFFACILDRFYHYYKNGGHEERYKELCFVIGRDITVIKDDRALPARALDIDDNCRLIVRYADGQTEALSSGEISIKL